MGTSFHAGLAAKPWSYVWKTILCLVSLAIRTTLRKLERVTVNREFWKLTEEGLWLWSFSLCGISVRGAWKFGSFAADLVVYEKKTPETGISLHGGSSGQTGVGLSLGEFERRLKESLEVERLSLSLSLSLSMAQYLCEGNLDGGLRCLGS